MDLLTENRPETCAALGLKCGACVRDTAASVAGICRGLQTDGIQQIFFQLYSSPGCRPMAQAFEMAYRESSQPVQPMLTLVSAASAAA
ncbi:MAG: hypothetical protein LAP38_07605 [Acidobacteriia bacterium]|nr:hypothetical protein [Terriglobia bacterium]